MGTAAFFLIGFVVGFLLVSFIMHLQTKRKD